MSAVIIEVHDIPGRGPLAARAAKIQSLTAKWFDKVAIARAYQLSCAGKAASVDGFRAKVARLLHDPVIETVVPSFSREPDVILEIRWLPGVTDNPGNAAAESIAIALDCGEEIHVSSGETIFGWFAPGQSGDLDSAAMKEELRGLLAAGGVYNPLVQRVLFRDEAGEAEAARSRPAERSPAGHVRMFPVDMEIDEWVRIADECHWALSRDELLLVLQHYRRADIQVARHEAGLPSGPTDVEMEIIAQSWSEHCKHKIFAAEIDYCEQFDPSGSGLLELGAFKVKSLFKSEIVRATREVESRRGIKWLSSTFSDNAGMMRFDENLDVSVKVETHNSPSALDPYGGALTGILGVNRDILGTGMGARPVANTDVLCFGMPDWTTDEVKEFLPAGLKHPSQVMEGVHRGIQDGGNKSGIPVVNGAFVFDDQYCGKPLVYCGTVGVSPAKLPNGRDGARKYLASGDLVVMAGGRVGKDGIHGATFSSLELNEASPSSAVQIGDPLTQKRLLDFVIEARDAGLYSGITDNGAGGLSSSVGEMSQFTGGATIDAALVPLKYPGLDPWEIVVSESQERMTLAVPREKWNALSELARVHGVEVTNIGAFDGSGAFRIRWNDKPVGSLPIHFLHKELKPMRLEAVWRGPQKKPHWLNRKATRGADPVESSGPPTMGDAVRRILGRPNVRSKEPLVRRFDHEVQAATAGKPFTGVAADGPADGGVIWLRPHGAADPWSGVAIASGINSKVAHVDTWLSAQLSLDEAVRNAVASGADPDLMCLVDNFCWPDPLPGKSNPDAGHKLAQLVRSARALAETSIAWGMPFVSGKDSMKNDFSGTAKNGERVKISVPPTVLVTAVGKVPDVRRLAGSDFKAPDSIIYLVGPEDGWPLEGSEYAAEFEVRGDATAWPRLDLGMQLAIYRKVHRAMMDDLVLSCHDVSDGGLAAAVCESAIGGRLGCQVEGRADLSWWFHEGPGRFVLSVDPARALAFEGIMSSAPFRKIGRTKADSLEVIFVGDGREVFRAPVNDVVSWWRG